MTRKKGPKKPRAARKFQGSAGGDRGDQQANQVKTNPAPDPVPQIPIPASVPVPTQHRDNAQRRHTKHLSGARRRLGVTPEQMRGVPRIAHILSHAEGGISTVIAALRLCEDSDARKFLARYDDLSESDLGYLSVEEICVAAEVAPKRLLELAVSALVEDSRSSGAIIAASYHPKVIRATAENAIQWANAQSDRKVFLQGTGFLPQPVNRPGGVFVNISNVAPVPALPESDGGSVDDGLTFNAAEDDLKILHEHIDGAKLLEAPRTVENSSAITIGHQYRDDELSCVPTPTPTSPGSR